MDDSFDGGGAIAALSRDDHDEGDNVDEGCVDEYSEEEDFGVDLMDVPHASLLTGDDEAACAAAAQNPIVAGASAVARH